VYPLIILLVLAVVGTGGGYVKGRSDGGALYQAKAEAAEAKVTAQAKQLQDEALQKQADVVAAFDKGRAEVQEKTKIVYVKGAQYAANDKGLSNPVCRMDDASLLLLNGARADVSTAAAAVAALGLSEFVADKRPVIRSAVPAVDQGRGTVPGVSSQPAQLRSTDAVPGNNLSLHPKPNPVGK
jgi:hypothetical protein